MIEMSSVRKNNSDFKYETIGLWGYIVSCLNATDCYGLLYLWNEGDEPLSRYFLSRYVSDTGRHVAINIVFMSQKYSSGGHIRRSRRVEVLKRDIYVVGIALVGLNAISGSSSIISGDQFPLLCHLSACPSYPLAIIF